MSIKARLAKLEEQIFSDPLPVLIFFEPCSPHEFKKHGKDAVRSMFLAKRVFANRKEMIKHHKKLHRARNGYTKHEMKHVKVILMTSGKENEEIAAEKLKTEQSLLVGQPEPVVPSAAGWDSEAWEDKQLGFTNNNTLTRR